MFALRDGTQTENPRLDRLVEFDRRSRAFPVAAIAPPAIRGRSWWINSWLDQGRQGACTAFAFAHEAAASPAIVPGLDATFARERIYYPTQRSDRWPGGEYPGADPVYEGTSVLAAAKVMQGLGFFDSYHWAFTIDEVLRAISNEGPVVFGIPWKDTMDDPRPSGLLDCTGTVVGGHAILGRALSLKPRLPGETNAEPVIRLHNSWGKNWGPDGGCFITVSDLEQLLDDQGECCCPVGRRRPHLG